MSRRPSPSEIIASTALLKSNLHDLIGSWRKRARAAKRGGMVQIAMDYNDCADELYNVLRGRKVE